jgi:hypothetical protein
MKTKGQIGVKLGRFVAATLAVTSMILLALSLGCYASYRNDISYLRSIVRAKISTDNSPGVFASINHWVYGHKGFKKNQDYFLLEALGPTPIQILDGGGDCTDKSMLLMAMLESIGIDSTLTMLYDTDGETPTHTVVEVRHGPFRAVADPVYDLVFPNPSGGFYGTEDLRRNPALLLNRLDSLIQVRGVSDKIIYYRRENESYRFASPINWNKGDLLKAMSKALEAMGTEPRNIRRPHFLDDPKLFTAVLLFSVSALFVTLAFLVKRMTRNNPA